MMADAFVQRHDGRRGENSQAEILVVEVRDNGVIGSALIAPLGIRDDGVVVIDQLAADAHAEPLAFGVAELDISQLQIQTIRVRWLQRRILPPRAGVLDLADNRSQLVGLICIRRRTRFNA